MSWRSRARSLSSRPIRDGFGHELRCGVAAGTRRAGHHRRSRFLGADGLSRRSVGAAARGGDDRRLAICRRKPGRHARGALRREPRCCNAVFRRGLSLGVNDGSSAIRLYRTEVVNALSARGDRLRHPAGSAGARLRRRMARAGDAAALRAESDGDVEGAPGARARRLFAHSGPCGSCAIRSQRPTTTTARTTARSRCSAIGSGGAMDIWSS